MKNEQFTPRPTEYMGVIFRSKSEAIFALNLTSLGFYWEYEPERFRTKDGWVPDFWAVNRFRGTTKIVSMVIEYKPDLVTKTYMDELSARFRSLGDKIEDHNEILACGNAYNKIAKVFNFYDGRWDDINPFLFRGIAKSAMHRFDLNS